MNLKRNKATRMIFILFLIFFFHLLIYLWTKLFIVYIYGASVCIGLKKAATSIYIYIHVLVYYIYTNSRRLVSLCAGHGGSVQRERPSPIYMGRHERPSPPLPCTADPLPRTSTYLGRGTQFLLLTFLQLLLLLLFFIDIFLFTTLR